jgi:hypothetical protein
METTSPVDASHEQAHLGYPQDWSSRHLLMPGMRAEEVLAAGAVHDPRYVYNMVMRQVAVEIKTKSAAPAARHQDRLGGFSRERVRSPKPVSGEIPVRCGGGELQL